MTDWRLVPLFTCASCRKTFEKAWSDKERDAECAENFPLLPDEYKASVCDDCYARIMADHAPGKRS